MVEVTSRATVLRTCEDTTETQQELEMVSDNLSSNERQEYQQHTTSALPNTSNTTAITITYTLANTTSTNKTVYGIWF